MIYDFRQYTFKPGAIPDYMKAVEELSIPIRAKYGVKLAGWYYSDVGELNQVVHIWGYRDYAHLDEAKKQVAADPDWTGKYLPAVRGLIQAQKTYLMLSPEFAPQPALKPLNLRWSPLPSGKGTQASQLWQPLAWMSQTASTLPSRIPMKRSHRLTVASCCEGIRATWSPTSSLAPSSTRKTT